MFRDFVRYLKVTNHAAERGLVMIESITNTVIRDESQLQWLCNEVPFFKSIPEGQDNKIHS